MKSGNAAFIKEIHDDKYDPNCKLLLARDDKELSAKANGFPAQFIVGRQRALVEQAKRLEAAPYKEFYEAKTAGNGGLQDIYLGGPRGCEERLLQAISVRV